MAVNVTSSPSRGVEQVDVDLLALGHLLCLPPVAITAYIAIGEPTGHLPGRTATQRRQSSRAWSTTTPRPSQIGQTSANS